MAPQSRLRVGTAACDGGFTFVELMVVLVIAGLLLAVVAPASMRFYRGVEQRQAVRDVVGAMTAARFRAVNSGHFEDVAINPATKILRSGGRDLQLPAALEISVRTAQEVNREQEGVIRFYPEGGSSGGDIRIQRPGGATATVTVDWLMGGATLVPDDVR